MLAKVITEREAERRGKEANLDSHAHEKSTVSSPH